MPLTSEERGQYRAWLEEAEHALTSYNGSEVSEEALFQPLLAMDDFVRSKNDGTPSDALVRAFAEDAWPENNSIPRAFNDLMDAATQTYKRNLRGATNYQAVLTLLATGKAVVVHHAKTFVQTDAGQIAESSTPNPQPLEFRTQPRLARLIEHLKDAGIYSDDIIAHVSTPDPGMVRRTANRQETQR